MKTQREKVYAGGFDTQDSTAVVEEARGRPAYVRGFDWPAEMAAYERRTLRRCVPTSPAVETSEEEFGLDEESAREATRMLARRSRGQGLEHVLRSGSLPE